MSLSSNKGRLGEDLAENYFLARGFSVLKRNYRQNCGEIDLIVKKSGVIIFVEVKTWDGLGSFDLGYIINKRKIKRIINASHFFLRDYKYSYSSYQYDVLLIKKSGTVYEHYRNILME